MNTQLSIHRRGFSLLEVLIAMLVLSFGLLALASLQASLMRNSTEAKARSVALSLGKDRLEQVRSFSSLAEYEALTDGTGSFADSAGSLGGVDYTVTTTVARYAFASDPDGDPATDDGVFEAVADTGALGSDYASDNEFKTVTVSVGWTDSEGVNQSVVLEDAIGAVAPENSGRLARRKPDSAARKPVVIIQDPSADPGVIPIAIGDGSETAATNPRPVVDTETAQTSYDVYTYAALLDGSGNAQAQSRVETRVIGCRCDFAQAEPDGVAFRPTFWDGSKYVDPAPAGTPISGEANLTGGDPTQSVLCSACCRDHHDPTGVAGPKFSPRRSSHDHFDDITADPSAGEYWEACRMIRTEGIFRVAADAYNEAATVIKTAVASGDTEPFTDPAPDGTASDAYVDFVIDYLKTQAAQGSPNSQLSQEAVLAKTDAAGLDIGAVDVEISQERWMHARGLYVDWLESEAIEAISEAADDCPDNLTADECLLRVLPFTSINVTELAKWSPMVEDSDAIYVANDDFALSTLAAEGEQDPVRGRVTAVAPGVATATASLDNSNVGLLANIDFAVNPLDSVAWTNNVERLPDYDGQDFEVQGPACGVVIGGVVPISRGESLTLTSGACDGSNPEVPISSTRVRLRLNLGTGPSAALVTLTAPDGQSYNIGSTSWATLEGVHLFDVPATADPRLGGAWILTVTSDHNTGSAQPTEVGFSVDFLYMEAFDVLLSGYDFAGSTTPSAGSTLVTCDPFTASNNPSACGTTSPGATDTLVLTRYNYEYVGSTPQDVACGALSCSTAKRCKNFDVTGVTLNGTSLGAGTVASSGRTGEATSIVFPGGVVQDDQVVVTMVVGTESAPVCVIPGATPNNCNQTTRFTFSCE